MKKLLLFIVTMMPSMMTWADAVEVDGIYYNLIPKGKVAEVTSNPYMYTGSVDIPSIVTYNGEKYNVTIIGDSSFYGCSGLTSLTIPNGVKSIGWAAFQNCTGLTSLAIPDGVQSIGGGAFQNCISLTSLVIPNSVNRIESSAFRNCSGLTSISIPNFVTFIGDGAFDGCSGLTSVHISDIAAWCRISFENILSNPLYFAHHLYLEDKEIKDLVIPSNVTTIGKCVFAGCSGLTSVTIHNNVTNIGGEAFFYCSGLTSITIPNSVTSINYGAFQGCSGLINVAIPNSITRIEECVFNHCLGLTSVIIPNSVTHIDNGAFAECSALTTVTIGNRVKEIWNQAFDTCKELTDVYCLAYNVPYTVTNTFDNSYIEYATLHVPEESISAYKSISPWSSFGNIVKINMSKYNLTYMIDGEKYKEYKIEEGEVITPEPNPSKEGYTFCGWSKIPETMPAYDITIIGKFVLTGDANGNDTVDEADIEEVVNYIMGHPSDKIDMIAADANHDGKLNVADIVEIINIFRK